MARRQRPFCRQGYTGMRRHGTWAAKRPPMWPHQIVQESKPGNAPKLVFSAMDASCRHRDRAGLRRSRPHRRLQFPQPPHGERCAAAGAGSQSRSPWAASPIRPATRLERANCHQPQLLHRGADHGACSAPHVRHRARAGHDHAGHLRCGLPRSFLHRHQCQRSSLHRRRRRKDAAGNTEDPRRNSQATTSASACRHGKRPVQSRAGDGWPPPCQSRSSFGAKPSLEEIRKRLRNFSQPAPAAQSPQRPDRSPCSTCTQQDRPQPRKDVERERGMAVFTRPPAPMPVCSGTSSWRSATTPCAAPREPPC